MYWIKTVEGQDVESIATAIDYNRNTSSMPNEGNTPTITCCYLIHAKDYQKHQYAAVTF